MNTMNSTKMMRLGVVAGSILILDQVTKALILAHLPLGGSIAVIPGFFDLTHVHNPGGAFGFLAGMSAEVRSLLFIAVSLVAAGLILYFYWQTPLGQRFLSVGLALIFGGAVGNLVDRMRFGIVVDFLDVYAGTLHWPAFNVADSAITIGVGIFAYHILFRKIRPDS
jgi:signal peptidase II